MKRTTAWFRGAVVAVALALVVATGLVSEDRDASAQRSGVQMRPNVLVIETDDQTVESMKVMSRTQQLLARQGVTFDNSFVSFSLCCPSRATFLTGQYAHNHGVLHNMAPRGGYYKLDHSNVLPVWLQRAGYYTAHIGKYLNEYGVRNAAEVPRGWSEWHGSVDPSTYSFFGYRLNEGGKVTRYCADRDPACYQTDVYARKAGEIIRRRAPSSQPFFLWLAFVAPHSGAPADPDDPKSTRRGERALPTPHPAPRHRNAFRSMPLPQPPSFNEADMSDKPSFLRGRRLLTAADVAAVREMYQQRLESLLAVDEAVSSVVTALRRTGELERTLIIFTSDNGFFHGEHRIKDGKVHLYEPSIRVPLIIRGPGVPRGVHRRQLVANIDLAPTIVAAARANAGRAMDGRSLFPLIRDGGREWGRDLLLESMTTPDAYVGIRTRNFLYTQYADGTPEDRELYDLRRDPHELESAHRDAARAGIREALAARLRRLVTCKGADCRARPSVRLRLTYRAGRRGCVRSSLRTTVTGRGVQSVRFSVGRRVVVTDSRAPFAANVAMRRVRGRSLIRARVAVTGDRVITVDRLVRRCR